MRFVPRLEELEDRCVLSATTTVPSLTEMSPFVAVSDIISVMQPKGTPTVAFVGDSISWMYANGTGGPVWNTYMAPLGMANYGVAGQTTQSLLFQLSLGVLTGTSPSVVVMEIGANNLLEGNSPQDTAAGVIADVNMIHLFLPASHVIVLGVLPGKPSPTDPYRQEGAQTNQLVSQMLAGDPRATFLDVGSMFVQPDGTISSNVLFDYIHPSEEGYSDLTNVLLPVIEQYLFPNLVSLFPNSSTAAANPSAALPDDTIPIELSGISLRALLMPFAFPIPTQPPSPISISP